MRIVFKETTENGKVSIEPLFAANDGGIDQVSIETIIEKMNDLVKESKNIKITELYASDNKFVDCPPRPWKDEIKKIYFLLKIVDDHPDEILRVSDGSYELRESSELLNKEVKEENVRYKVCNVRGELRKG